MTEFISKWDQKEETQVTCSKIVCKRTRIRNKQYSTKNVVHSGLSSLGVPGVPWHKHPQILADQLTLSQPGGADYAHQIIQASPDFQTFLRPWHLPKYLDT